MIPRFPRQSGPRHTFTALMGFATIVTHAAATCYWPNATLFGSNPDPSTVSADDHACDPSAANSVCCGTGWTCLSDGVCKINQEGNDYFYRGTCTDSTWKSQSCPGFCFQQNNATTEPLAKCNTPNVDWYCCAGDDQCNCDTGKFAVQLNGPATTLTVIGSKETSTSKSASSSSTLASTSPTATKPTSPATALASPTPAPSGSSHGTAIGVGVGVGIGVVIVAAIGIFFFRRKARQRKGGDDALKTEQYHDGPSPPEPYMFQALETPIHEAPGSGGRYNGRNVGEEPQEMPQKQGGIREAECRVELPAGGI